MAATLSSELTSERFLFIMGNNYKIEAGVAKLVDAPALGADA